MLWPTQLAGQTVLVICQKQAALRVVQKRLEAENLGDRLFMVDDPARDRQPIIKAVREQFDKLRGLAATRLPLLRRLRDEKATRIDSIEAEIDRHHAALHHPDDRTSYTYRDLLGSLMDLEAQGPFMEIASLAPS